MTAQKCLLWIMLASLVFVLISIFAPKPEEANKPDCPEPVEQEEVDNTQKAIDDILEGFRTGLESTR